MKIQKINKDEAMSIIKTRSNKGLFLFKEDNKWIGIDNTTGDAFTEAFDYKDTAINWLLGKFDLV